MVYPRRLKVNQEVTFIKFWVLNPIKQCTRVRALLGPFFLASVDTNLIKISLDIDVFDSPAHLHTHLWGIQTSLQLIELEHIEKTE